MKRIKKKFTKPRVSWDSARISEESAILNEFGLRRKRELRVAENFLRGFRGRARKLIAEADEHKEKVLIDKLVKLGMLEKGSNLDDVLALDVKNILSRRLQSVVLKKSMAETIKHARQVVVHGKIAIGDRRTDIPSYLVPVEEENTIGWFNKPKGAANAKEN